jgi:hypothetical protein
MSPTTAAAMDSRSSSPETPETSDVPHNVTIHNEPPSWYIAKDVSAITVWDGDPFQKLDDERMLKLDDILQEHAYDEYAHPCVSLSPAQSPCSSACSGVESSPANIRSLSDATQPELASLEPLRTSLRRESGLSIPPLSQMHSPPIVPPPAMRTCKRDPASISRRVAYPPRESCYKYVVIHISFHRLITISLAILTPNIPESGTKSRVETQVRVTVDLAHASTSVGEQNQYDRVGSWKWLKLPPGTATKRRTRREGKIGECFLSVIPTLTLTRSKTPHL